MTKELVFRGETYSVYTWRWNALAGGWQACFGCNLYPAYRMVSEWRYDHEALVKPVGIRARFINTMRYW